MKSPRTCRSQLDLSELNPAQREAVQTIHGPLLLLAGAGTGKTRVITVRIAHLLSTGIPASQILAVTFTNKAAREMRARLNQLMPAASGPDVTVGTFHSFCLRLLRRHSRALGYSPGFAIAGDDYQLGLVRTVMAELGCTGEGKDPRLWRAEIGRMKSALQTPADLLGRPDLPFAAELAEVAALYQKRLRQMDLMDFDDLLVLVLDLWREHAEILERHRAQYRYLLIDEYQDTNAVQFQLMATLAGPDANICAVGDDDQSIYGWRGADLGNILDFETSFPNTRIIRLEQNYRSTETILAAASAVIAHNRRRHVKRLWSDRGRGDKVMVVRTESEQDEAGFCADMIRETRLRSRADYRDFAILFRSNHQSRALEASLRKRRIPYTLVGTRSFYQRKEILDLVSLLKVVDNPKDDLSLLRILNVPPRGIGDQSITRLKELGRATGLPLQELLPEPELLNRVTASAAAALGSFHACLQRSRAQFREPGDLTRKIEDLLAESGYTAGLARMYKPREDALRRRENVFEFMNEIVEFAARQAGPSTLSGFLETFSLLDANDKEEQHAREEQGAVTLMTVHAAKGLEFPHVLIVGLERGLFPHLRALQEGTEEEERRLFYVALTRARNTVTLTYADLRRARGHLIRRRPSPYIDDLPDDLVALHSPADALQPASAAEAADYLARMKAMFAPNQDGARPES